MVGKCHRHTTGSSAVSWKYNHASALPNCIRKLIATRYIVFVKFCIDFFSLLHNRVSGNSQTCISEFKPVNKYLRTGDLIAHHNIHQYTCHSSILLWASQLNCSSQPSSQCIDWLTVSSLGDFLRSGPQMAVRRFWSYFSSPKFMNADRTQVTKKVPQPQSSWEDFLNAIKKMEVGLSWTLKFNLRLPQLLLVVEHSC